MDSELQRLRMRVRQLERELRALRSAARERDVAEPSPAATFPPASALYRWRRPASQGRQAPEPS